MKIKTFDGKLIESREIKYRELSKDPQKLMEVMDEEARKNPAAFAEACAVELGIGYVPPKNKHHGEISWSVLLCCDALHRGFGYFTDAMVEALMSYPIEV